MNKIKSYNYDTLFTPLKNELDRNESEIKFARCYQERKVARTKMEHTYQTIDRIVSLIGTEFVGQMEKDKNLSIQLNEDLVNEVMAF